MNNGQNSQCLVTGGQKNYIPKKESPQNQSSEGFFEKYLRCPVKQGFKRHIFQLFQQRHTCRSKVFRY